jgi:hypothetical protein
VGPLEVWGAYIAFGLASLAEFRLPLLSIPPEACWPLDQLGAACRGTYHETVQLVSVHSPMLFSRRCRPWQDLRVLGRQEVGCWSLRWVGDSRFAVWFRQLEDFVASRSTLSTQDSRGFWPRDCPVLGIARAGAVLQRGVWDNGSGVPRGGPRDAINLSALLWAPSAQNKAARARGWSLVEP